VICSGVVNVPIEKRPLLGLPLVLFLEKLLRKLQKNPKKFLELCVAFCHFLKY